MADQQSQDLQLRVRLVLSDEDLAQIRSQLQDTGGASASAASAGASGRGGASAATNTAAAVAVHPSRGGGGGGGGGGGYTFGRGFLSNAAANAASGVAQAGGLKKFLGSGVGKATVAGVALAAVAAPFKEAISDGLAPFIGEFKEMQKAISASAGAREQRQEFERKVGRREDVIGALGIGGEYASDEQLDQLGAFHMQYRERMDRSRNRITDHFRRKDFKSVNFVESLFGPPSSSKEPFR